MTDRDDDTFAHADTWFNLTVAVMIAAIVAAFGVAAWVIIEWRIG